MTPAGDGARARSLRARDAGRDLLSQVLEKQNMESAWKRVKSNRGAAGVDGLDIAQTKRYLVTAWPTIRDQLMAGTYRPSPVRRVGIPTRWQRARIGDTHRHGSSDPTGIAASATTAD